MGVIRIVGKLITDKHLKFSLKDYTNWKHNKPIFCSTFVDIYLLDKLLATWAFFDFKYIELQRSKILNLKFENSIGKIYTEILTRPHGGLYEIVIENFWYTKSGVFWHFKNILSV